MADSRVLETARLRLTSWQDRHAALLERLSSLPAVVRYVGDGLPWQPPRVARAAEVVAAHWREHGFGWRVAYEHGATEPIGFIALNYAGEGTPGLAADEFEIGWWLAPAAWGRGLAREGAAAVRDEALERLGAPGLVARIQPENVASVAVAEAIGMTAAFDTVGRYGEPVRVYRL